MLPITPYSWHVVAGYNFPWQGLLDPKLFQRVTWLLFQPDVYHIPLEGAENIPLGVLQQLAAQGISLEAYGISSPVLTGAQNLATEMTASLITSPTVTSSRTSSTFHIWYSNVVVLEEPCSVSPSVVMQVGPTMTITSKSTVPVHVA